MFYSFLLVEDSHFDEHIFQMGWFKPPTTSYKDFSDFSGKMIIPAQHGYVRFVLFGEFP